MIGRPSGMLHRVGAVARRDLLVELSYQFRLLFFFVGAVVSSFLAYYVSDLVGNPAVLQPFDGSYFDFVIVGLALVSYTGLGVSAFAGQILQEQGAGTLEVLLGGPTPLFMLLAGGFVIPLALTTVEVALLLGVGVGVLGIGLSAPSVLLAIPVVALTVVNFCALGIASAAVVLLVKRGDPISGPVYQANLLLSGAIFPVELFPAWVVGLSRLTPAYYGVRGLREALLTDVGPAGVTDELLVLAGFAIVCLPAAVRLFAWSVARAKRLGVLGSY